MIKFLTTSVFIGLASLFSFSQDQPCNENTLLAVPDVFVIEEADILSFQANVLDNDIINVDDFYVNPHGVPPCFVLSDEGIISISPDADPTFILEECCGNHFFWYTLISEGFQCQTEVEFTINCDASKNDCSFIDLSTVIADGGAAGGEEPASCIPVCGGALTTITYPFDPQNVYEWTVIGGDIETQLYDNEILVVWQASANTGSVILEIINDSGSQTIIQCVEIGQPPIADFQNIGLACKGSDVQFNSLSTPINADHFWDFGDGSTSTAVNPIHSYNDGGIYEIMLTVTTPLFNDSGEVVCCCSDIELGMIEITNTEGPTIECISTLCAGDNACYYASSGCPTADYSWELFDADGNPLPFDGNGTDKICVQWGDGPFGTVNLQILGCSDICDEWTSVNIPIIAENSTPIGPNVVCENEVATYSVPKWMDVIYSWQVVGAESFTTDGNQVSVVWGSAGVGYIEVFYESPFLQSVEGHAPPDCSGFGMLDILIQPELKFIYNSQFACADMSTVFMTNSPNVIWSVDPFVNFSPSGDECVVHWDTPGIYTVTAQAIDPQEFCNQSVSTTVMVSSIDPPSIEGEDVGCADTPYLYFIDPPSPGVTYYWVCTGGTITTATNTAEVVVEWSDASPSHQLTVFASQTSSPFCSAMSSSSFTLLTPGIPDDIIEYSNACANQIVNYSVTAMSGNWQDETLTWEIVPPEAGSIVASQGPTVSIQWNDFSGPAEIIVTSSLCGLSESLNTIIIVTEAEVPEIIQIGHLCTGALTDAKLTTTSVFGDYNWTDPNLNSSTSNTYTVLTSGMHELTTEDGNGCAASAYFEVFASPDPIASISSPQLSSLCIPSTGTIDLYTPNNNNWEFLWNGSLGTHVFSHTIQNSAGSYPYDLVVSDITTGCSATDLYIITEQTCPGGGSGGCTPIDSLHLTWTQDCDSVGVSIDSPDASNEQYNFGDGTGSSSSSQHVYSSAGCYVIAASADIQSCPVTEYFGICVPVAANFDYTTENCTTVNFTDLSTWLENPNPANQITTWQWNFGDGNTSSSQNPTHNYTVPNTYSVSLTVTDAAGCTATYSADINIGTVPPPVLTYNNIACLNSPENYSASAVGAVSYQWLFPDGVQFNGPSIEHTFTALIANPGTILVTATDAYGCSSDSSFPIDVFDLPTIELYSNPTPAVVCAQPGTALLSASMGWSSYTWLDENESIQTVDITGVPIDPISNELLVGSGTYTVVSYWNGCKSISDPVNVQVLQPVQVPLTGPTIICGDDQATYQCSGNFTNHKWFVDGVLFLVNSSTLDFSSAVGQTHTIHLEATDPNGCVHASDILSTTWVEDVQFALASPNVPPCAGDDVLIQVIANPISILPLEVSWNTGDTGEDIVVQNAGIYTATAYNSDGCSSSESFEVFPVPDLCTVPSGCYSSCVPVEICGPVDLAYYQWFLDGLPIAGGNSNCILLDQSGTYNLEAGNDFGCYTISNSLEFTLDDCECDIAYELTPQGEECCHTISFDNNSTLLMNNIDFHTPSQTADFSVIHPDYNISQLDPFRITLAYNGPSIPTGVTNDIIEICPNLPAINPVIIEVTWELDSLFQCSDELSFSCESDTSSCLPFSCENSLYQVFGTDGQIGFFDPDNTSGGFTVLANSYDDGNNSPADADDHMNAVGYNTNDNYAYGFARDAQNQVILVQIGNDGCINPLGEVKNHMDNVWAHPIEFSGGNIINGTLIEMPNQGDFSKVNSPSAIAITINAWNNQSIPIPPPPYDFELLHVRQALSPWINVVDVVTQTVVYTYNLSGDAASASTADFARNNIDGLFYGVDDLQEQLVAFDPIIEDAVYIGGVNDAVGATPLDCNNWGAAYSDVNGRIYFTCNFWNGLPSQNTYEVDRNTGFGTPMFDTGSGDVVYNDGFSCPDAAIINDEACISLFGDTLHCNEDQSGYIFEFEICNNPNSNFEIGYFTISSSNPNGAQFTPSTFTLAPGDEILPGACAFFSTLISGVTDSDEICIFISAHEEDPANATSTACCIVEECFPIEECDSDCAEVEFLEIQCDNEQWFMESVIINNSQTTVGYVQLSYPGVSGTISDLISVGSIPHGDPIYISHVLSPLTLASNPFCLDIVLHEAGPLGTLIECCQFEYCFDLPECGPELVVGCTDPAASNFDPAAEWDDSSCVYCTDPNLINPSYPCADVIDEVCGCNGITYINLCYAMRFGGIISWTPGICDEQEETDDGTEDDNFCPTDINADGATNVGDLLMVLGEFGGDCE